jgi:hypothetical protein
VWHEDSILAIGVIEMSPNTGECIDNSPNSGVCIAFN